MSDERIPTSLSFDNTSVHLIDQPDHQPAMDHNNSEKKYSGSDLEATVGPANTGYGAQTGGAHYEEVYDPSLESKWTRAGLTWESFKRAPGTTK